MHPLGLSGERTVKSLLYGVPRNAAAALHVVLSVILEYPAGQALVLAAFVAYVAAHTCRTTAGVRAAPSPRQY